MKNKVLSFLICFCLMAGVMSGCGNGTNATLADATVTIEENQTTEEPTEGSIEGSVEEPTEETAEEPVKEPAKVWFEEHELVITPQGDFTFTTMADDEDCVPKGTFEVKANVSISETTDGVMDGYKEVTMVCTLDVSAADDVVGATAYWDQCSAFDRYTGISFSSNEGIDDLLAFGEDRTDETFLTIVNGDNSYDVSFFTEKINGYPVATRIITVTCPVDYDGVVFQVGYCDAELNEAEKALDDTERLYTIDELPYYGDGYYYFSYSNE